MFRNKQWIAAVVLALLLGFVLVRQFNSENVVPVHVQSPAFRDLDTSVTSNGKVTPLDDLPIRASLSAVIDKIYVHVGDKVKVGQRLMLLSDPFARSRYTSAVAGLRSAQVAESNIRGNGSQEDRINFAGELTRAKLELTDAKKQLALLKQLAGTGAASEGEVESAEHRLALAQTSVETITERNNKRYSATEASSVKARVEDAKASVVTAQAILANANIASTIAGTVYSLPVSEHDYVNTGAELIRITDLSKLQIHAYIDEPDMGQLEINQPVVVSWLARPNKVWHGHVTQTPLTVSNRGVRTVGDCIISIDDADGTLLPNTDVAVLISTHHYRHVLAIPRAALHSDGPEHFVYRLSDNRLVRTPIKLGVVTLDDVEVLSGVGEHDVIAISSLSNQPLADHLKVEPVK